MELTANRLLKLAHLSACAHTHTHSITNYNTLLQAAEDVSKDDELPEVQIHREVSKNPTQKR